MPPNIPQINLPEVPNIPKDQIEILDTDDSEEEDEKLNCCPQTTYLDYCLYILYFIFWATLYLIFIKLGFGIVYFLSSAIIAICLNTSTAPKQEGEVSAYSVFNKDCKPIDGALSAAQFEREIGIKM